MDKKIIWFLTAMCFILILLIYKKTQEPLSIQNYLINTYLYIALAIAMIGSSWVCMSVYEIELVNNGFNNMGLFMVSLGALFTVMFTPNDQMLLKHAAWVTLILTLAITTHIFFKINIENKTLIKTFVTLFGIIGVFTYIAFVMEPTVFLSWGVPLTYALCAVIVTEVTNALFFAKSTDDLLINNNMWNWLVVVLFSGFILFDTQKIITKGTIINELCQSKNQLQCADYPTESLGVVLDALNLFNRITLINRN